MTTLQDRLPTPPLPLGAHPCTCDPNALEQAGGLQLVVLTGGPGAGKTAVLEAARATFCRHVAAVPEAASIIFSGGFPRHETRAGRECAQRAIFHVQREGERLVEGERVAHGALCDRGTVDGVAYWPGDEASYWRGVGTSREVELARYALVVHLRTPDARNGYHLDGVRTEDVQLAHEIDERILAAWDGHPRRIVIDASTEFESKLHAAISAIREVLPVRLVD